MPYFLFGRSLSVTHNRHVCVCESKFDYSSNGSIAIDNQNLNAVRNWQTFPNLSTEKGLLKLEASEILQKWDDFEQTVLFLLLLQVSVKRSDHRCGLSSIKVLSHLNSPPGGFYSLSYNSQFLLHNVPISSSAFLYLDDQRLVFSAFWVRFLNRNLPYGSALDFLGQMPFETSACFSRLSWYDCLILPGNFKCYPVGGNMS